MKYFEKTFAGYINIFFKTDHFREYWAIASDISRLCIQFFVVANTGRPYFKYLSSTQMWNGIPLQIFQL